MKRFALLYADLDATTSTARKVAALEAYFREAPDADAAWAVYFLGGEKPRQVVPTRVLRVLATETAGIPDWLFEECYQAVGDLAETIAHLLPEAAACSDTEATFAHWIEHRLLPMRKLDEPSLAAAVRAAWAELDAHERFVWNKLITGGFRVGVSRLLVTRAVAQVAGLEPTLVAERLLGEWQPTADAYRALCAREDAADRAGRPYPFFLAHPLDRAVETLGPRDEWQAEWKWDGIRAQVIARDGRVFVWSRGDEPMTDRLPEIAALGARLPDGTVLDGEALAWRDGRAAPFALLQQRIGRKQLTPKVLRDAPVAFVAYDLLEHEGRDVRSQPTRERRGTLEHLVRAMDDPSLVLSPCVNAGDWAGLAAERVRARALGVEGLMLKHLASPYGAGRVKVEGGGWWKWKLDPFSVDAVLVYAQRGHGRRASLYTDYTFAVWRGEELVPFAKAYSGLTDAEIREVDGFIRANTREKFGPVRSVTAALVMEIGFEGIQRSPRHKSGVAVRFPRILRIRHDKSVRDADSLEALLRLLG